jgi:hypothetical protein
MKFKLLLAFSFWMLLMAVSCNNDDISFDAPSQQLSFSRDTVFCDTVYHQVRSETYAVKVYNNEDKDILIPRIHLEKGAASLYKINVDGKPGYDFKDVPLRKKDSLYIFVEIAPEATGPEAIAEDKILFQSPQGEQNVVLFSVVQDAEFFIKTSSNPNVISNHTTWTNNKAKIIYGDLTIDENMTLDIQAGTKVYFHKNSGMKLLDGATLNINGTFTDNVILRGDRNDPNYDTIPKTWNSIKMDPGSNLNMNFARLFGGTKGLEMKQANATINNSFIHTFQEYGIFALASTVTAKNLVMNNCGESAVGIYQGGTHNFTHCTIANYSDLLSSYNRYGIVAANEWTDESGHTESGALIFNLKNSIVYSDRDNSVNLEYTPPSLFNVAIQNCLIKYSNQSEAGFDFNDNLIVTQSIKNEDPLFVNYFAAHMNLRVKQGSPAIGKGSTAVAGTVPTDIYNVTRTSNPTIGAYQYQ